MTRRIALFNTLLTGFLIYVTVEMNARPPAVELLDAGEGGLHIRRSGGGWPFPKYRETYERPNSAVALDSLGEDPDELAGRFKDSIRIKSKMSDGLNTGFYCVLALSLVLNGYLLLRPEPVPAGDLTE